MADLLEYKCPCCGGGIAFDSGLQKMKCPYCDTEFEMETLRAFDEELKQEQPDDFCWESKTSDAWQEQETDGLRSYVCNSCGGEIVGDDTLAATACPFCGNPVIMRGQFSGELRPDYVIPFQLDKQAAKEGFQKHLLNKRLLPKVFRDEAHLDEIKGMYVPFWLFDADADANLRYRATRTRSWTTRDRMYTETAFFLVRRAGKLGFNHVPVDGSSKMQDELMEALEPYDFSAAVDFQTAYLAGYLADKYDVPIEESIERANERIRKSTEQAFTATVKGYTTVVTERVGIRLEHGSSHYALYPVWLLNTTWQGKSYRFAMNGQTGKFVGDLPMDHGAFWKWFFGLLCGVSAGVFAVLALLWLL